jgi:hypothetical protein
LANRYQWSIPKRRKYSCQISLKRGISSPAKSTIKAWTFFQEKFGRPARVKLVAFAGVEQLGNAGLSIN